MFDFPCPQCGVKQPAVEAHIGKQRRCLYCGGEFTVPTESEAKALLGKPATLEQERLRRKRPEKRKPPRRPAVDPGKLARPMKPPELSGEPGPRSLRETQAGTRSAVPSIVGLGAANVALLAGVVFFGWDVRVIVFLFWAENIIVNVLTAWVVLEASRAGFRLPVSARHLPYMNTLFTLFHGIFVLLIITDWAELMDFGGGDETAPTPDTAQPGLATFLTVGLLVLGLCVSHVYGHLANARTRCRDLLAAAVRATDRAAARMVVMHVTIVLGLIATKMLEHSIGLVAVFVVLKTSVDYLLLEVARARKKPVERYEYRSVDPKEFSWLDAPFYDDVRTKLEAQGFRFLGDYENETLLRKSPRRRTFIRRMLSDDGTIKISCGQMKLQWWERMLVPWKLQEWERMPGPSGTVPPSDFQAVDLGTEFNDGTFLWTTNSEGLVKLDEITGLRIIQCPPSTLLPDMLEAHRNTIAQWTRRDPDYEPLCLSGIEQVWDSDHRFRELQNAYKHRTGGIFVGMAQS